MRSDAHLEPTAGQDFRPHTWSRNSSSGHKDIRKGESEFQSNLVLPAWMTLGKVSRRLMQENEDLRF